MDRTNAERQARWRARRKQELEALRNNAGEQSALRNSDEALAELGERTMAFVDKHGNNMEAPEAIEAADAIMARVIQLTVLRNDRTTWEWGLLDRIKEYGAKEILDEVFASMSVSEQSDFLWDQVSSTLDHVTAAYLLETVLEDPPTAMVDVVSSWPTDRQREFIVAAFNQLDPEDQEQVRSTLAVT